jgi:hypothetical protein
MAYSIGSTNTLHAFSISSDKACILFSEERNEKFLMTGVIICVKCIFGSLYKIFIPNYFKNCEVNINIFHL